jgi:hypothetical protein
VLLAVQHLHLSVRFRAPDVDLFDGTKGLETVGDNLRRDKDVGIFGVMGNVTADFPHVNIRIFSEVVSSPVVSFPVKGIQPIWLSTKVFGSVVRVHDFGCPRAASRTGQKRAKQ